MDTSGPGRGSVFVGLVFVAICVFALIVGWNGIINPPPKPTPQEVRDVRLRGQEVERKLMEAVREAEAQAPQPAAPPGTRFRVSDGSATEKLARARTLPPNWATQECVDIVLRYQSAPEAGPAADMLIEKWDHILHRDFLSLTGERLPVDYDMPRDEVVAILKNAFRTRGVPTSK